MSSADRRLHRSYLYAPGSDDRLLRKAYAAGADAVIADLEDAVAPARRAEAGGTVAAFLDEVAATPTSSGDPDGAPTSTPDAHIRVPDVHVRVARDGDGYDLGAVDAVVRPGLDGLRLPKVEDAAAVRDLAEVLDRLERDRDLPAGRIGLYPTVESARGAWVIADVLAASPRVVRAGIGTTDLLADLGASGDDDLATLHVRSQLVLASRVVGVGPPIDSVHTDLADVDGLERGARRARALGFVGKSVIHPRQLDVVHAVFTPSDDEVARAERVLAAAAAADASGSGTAVVDGAFVDAAVVARAQATLALRSKR